MTGQKKFLKNAAVLSLGGLVAKAIGIWHRLALAAELGGYGAGLYQLSYPPFVLLLALTSSGVPAALARLIAGRGAGREAGIMRSAFSLFLPTAVAAALAMALLSLPVSRMHAMPALVPCFCALAPALLFVVPLSLLRGFFQGRGEMLPTAFSEVMEQLVKTLGCLVLLPGAASPADAAVRALLSVTLSEAVTLVMLLPGYFRCPRLPAFPLRRGRLWREVSPVMASALVLPLSGLADSFVLVRLLGGGSAAVAAYGLFAGSALTILGLPAAGCSGLATAAVPMLGARPQHRGREYAMFALGVTMLLAAPCALGLLLFAPLVTDLLCPSLAQGERALLILMLRTGAISSALLAGVETLASCLAGMGRARRAAAAMCAAVVVKFALQLLLVPARSVCGAVIALDGCYLVAFLLDFVYTCGKKRKHKRACHDHDHRIGNTAGRSLPARVPGAAVGADRIGTQRISCGSDAYRGGDRL